MPLPRTRPLVTACALTAATAAFPVGCVSVSGLTGGGDDHTPPRDAGEIAIVLPEAAAADSGARDARSVMPTDARIEATAEAATLPAGAAIRVSVGTVTENQCVVRVNGDVSCWGDNEAGELGDGTTTSSLSPVKVKGLPEPAIDVGVGNLTTCALLSNREVYCWGYGADGELGDGSTSTMSLSPVRVHGLSDAVVLAVGDAVACVIQAAGTVACWGLGDGGALGTGSDANALVPTLVKNLKHVSALTVGGYTSCAVEDGSAYCWGADDGSGSLGDGTTDSSSVPVAVHGLPSGVTQVSAGASSVCAVAGGGAAFCWGAGMAGELGNGAVVDSSTPVAVTGLDDGIAAVATGEFGACARRTDGKVVCWGSNTRGSLGDGPVAPPTSGVIYLAATPVKVDGLDDRAVQLASGNGEACVTTAHGGVECWGHTALDALSPVPVSGLNDGVTAVTLGGGFDSSSFACAIQGGGISCWGGNALGELGTGESIASTLPVDNALVQSGATVISSGPGAEFACAVAGGQIYCWGANDAGQLGLGTRTEHELPGGVVGFVGTPLSVSAGGRSACAVNTAGGVYCWGDNSFGELGTGDVSTHSTPVAVVGLESGVRAVSVGLSWACAVLTSGALSCWGNNSDGELGDGTQNSHFTPKPVPNLTGVTAVSTGWYGTCAIVDGAVECWGYNGFGLLGNGNMTVSALTPQRVPNLPADATSVSVGFNVACAISGGALGCWGLSGLGDGFSESGGLRPGAVIGLTIGVTAVAAGEGGACAVANGGLWCWGSNTAGQLGIGEAPDDLVATPVVGFP